MTRHFYWPVCDLCWVCGAIMSSSDRSNLMTFTVSVSSWYPGPRGALSSVCTHRCPHIYLTQSRGRGRSGGCFYWLSGQLRRGKHHYTDNLNWGEQITWFVRPRNNKVRNICPFVHLIYLYHWVALAFKYWTENLYGYNKMKMTIPTEWITV